VTTAPLSIRRARPEDLPALFEADGRGFGFHYTEQAVQDGIPTLDPERFLLAVDGAEIVGVTGSYGFDVTPPGGAPVATEGVTWVSVAATHRRRGILRALFTQQHRGFVAAGVPLAVLTASEGGIYGRFGYGPATVDRLVEVDRRHAVWRADAPDPGGARYVRTGEFAALAPALHARWCARTPGAVSRGAAWWHRHLLDRDHARGGGSAMFHLAHPDGFASYRVADDVCRVVDLFAVTREAHLALWRVLLALDLVETVRTRALAADDPLPFLLADPRAVRQTDDRHGMWARVLDVPAALAARRYAVEVDVVLEVHDPVWGRGGRFHLAGGPDGAECSATDRPPAVHVDAAALGSVYFGGHRLRTLAAAGRAGAADQDLLRRLDVALAGAADPWYGTSF
jgi:predicted acetyltransferase